MEIKDECQVAKHYFVNVTSTL